MYPGLDTITRLLLPTSRVLSGLIRTAVSIPPSFKAGISLECICSSDSEDDIPLFVLFVCSSLVNFPSVPVWVSFDEEGEFGRLGIFFTRSDNCFFILAGLGLILILVLVLEEVDVLVLLEVEVVLEQLEEVEVDVLVVLEVVLEQLVEVEVLVLLEVVLEQLVEVEVLVLLEVEVVLLEVVFWCSGTGGHLTRRRSHYTDECTECEREDTTLHCTTHSI